MTGFAHLSVCLGSTGQKALRVFEWKSERSSAPQLSAGSRSLYSLFAWLTLDALIAPCRIFLVFGKSRPHSQGSAQRARGEKLQTDTLRIKMYRANSRPHLNGCHRIRTSVWTNIWTTVTAYTGTRTQSRNVAAMLGFRIRTCPSLAKVKYSFEYIYLTCKMWCNMFTFSVLIFGCFEVINWLFDS